MAFTVRYADGTVTDYDSKTKFTIDGGVLKMGAKEGAWTYMVSPSHWIDIQTDPPKPKKRTVTQIR